MSQTSHLQPPPHLTPTISSAPSPALETTPLTGSQSLSDELCWLLNFQPPDSISSSSQYLSHSMNPISFPMGLQEDQGTSNAYGSFSPMPPPPMPPHVDPNTPSNSLSSVMSWLPDVGSPDIDGFVTTGSSESSGADTGGGVRESDQKRRARRY
ncbi:hypothetical protein BC829DRAFT_284541 [Chytridium lagenaria]|nr:hypothetical protein BC829DRAFT_284541 [Chytridium lagenaria]